jgi:D-glycero-D-manno-heptose 1,7-bisphosphate phosphatase
VRRADRWAVLLDRDGVINAPVLNATSGAFESPYDPDAVELLDGVVDAVRQLRHHGAAIAVVSNQPGAAKGICTVRDLSAVHARIVSQLADGGVVIDHFGYCFHHPDAAVATWRQRCGCRKPAPGLLAAATRVLGVADISRCFVVGDSDVDIEAAEAFGCRSILIDQPLTAHRRRRAYPVRALNLPDAARHIIQVIEHESPGSTGAGGIRRLPDSV